MILPQKHDVVGGVTTKSDSREGGVVLPHPPKPRATDKPATPSAASPRAKQPTAAAAAPSTAKPARPSPPPPVNSFQAVEALVIQGLDYLAQSPPDLSAASKCLEAAEAEVNGREVPEKLSSRLRFFKESTERLRKDLLHQCIDRELKQIKPLLEEKPPRVERAGEIVHAANALLKEAPDPYLQLELEHLRLKIADVEKKLQQERVAQAVKKSSGTSSLLVRAAVFVLAGIGLMIAGRLLFYQPSGSSSYVGEMDVSVNPAGAELFTNGIAMGNQTYPVHFKGTPGEKVTVEARMTGYSNLVRTLKLPASGRTVTETLELQPLPATLVVQSEPAAHDVWVKLGGEKPLMASNAVQGITLNPGIPMEVSLAIADYAPVSRTVPPLQPGERRVLDFGNLQALTGEMELKVEPRDASFWVVYPGRDPIPFGANSHLRGITPKVPFKLIAEHTGYLSVTNAFNLKPGQLCECDLGRLKPISASLQVMATPRPFELQVEWDDQPRNFGQGGHADGLPPGKPLVVTVIADGCEAWTTNVVLEPAELRTLAVGKLPAGEGYLQVNSEPAAVKVSYSVDGGAEMALGITDIIPSLPLGHQVSVTVAKDGYSPVTKNWQFQHSGDTLDFGKLKPSLASLTEQVHRAAQAGDVASLEKILKEYSNDYPLLIDQPSEDGDAPTPLLAAVRKGQDKVVDYLVKSGANVNRPNRYRVTPLFEAARKGYVTIVKTLLNAHADVRSRNLSGQTPIFAVVLSSRNVEIANLLMAFGADPNVKDMSGETPLVLAEENHTDDILQALEHPPTLRVAAQP